jgi:hypothetical protein
MRYLKTAHTRSRWPSEKDVNKKQKAALELWLKTAHELIKRIKEEKEAAGELLALVGAAADSFYNLRSTAKSGLRPYLKQVQSIVFVAQCSAQVHYIHYNGFPDSDPKGTIYIEKVLLWDTKDERSFTDKFCAFAEKWAATAEDCGARHNGKPFRKQMILPFTEELRKALRLRRQHLYEPRGAR